MPLATTISGSVSENPSLVNDSHYPIFLLISRFTAIPTMSNVKDET
jgi:hypothetical protein